MVLYRVAALENVAKFKKKKKNAYSGAIFSEAADQT